MKAIAIPLLFVTCTAGAQTLSCTTTSRHYCTVDRDCERNGRGTDKKADFLIEIKKRAMSVTRYIGGEKASEWKARLVNEDNRGHRFVEADGIGSTFHLTADNRNFAYLFSNTDGKEVWTQSEIGECLVFEK